MTKEERFKMNMIDEFKQMCELVEKDGRIIVNKQRMLKALSQEPICDRDCEHCTWTECPIEPCDDAISRDFQIGDEVRLIGSDPIYDDCDVGWVIRNASEKVKTMYVMRNDGSAGEEAKAEWYKTGGHNAMLAEVIKALPSVSTTKNIVNYGTMNITL